MAVKIRLTRKGKKKQPSYRVVVADSRSPRDGRYIEQIGRYDPLKEPSEVVIDNERATYWLSVGAQPSDAVRKLLEISGAIGARTPKDPKVHVVGEEAQRAAAEAEAEVAAAAEIEEADAAAAPEADAGEPEAAAEEPAGGAGEAGAQEEKEES
jgi:small subunit ribosomal protein S16